MTFELLANELLLDLFDYFNTVDVFRAFYDLNLRFNTLLFCKFRTYHLDFQSVSKRNFDLICQQQLPFILNQIISLRLSDDDETPTLPNIFLSYGFTLDHFTRLKSLTLNHICCFDIVNKIITQCHSLPSLTHLSLFKCHLHKRIVNSPCLFNNIWSLSKLIDCNLSNIIPGVNLLSRINTISTSIQNLSLDGIPCDSNDLSYLFTYTPNLQRLRTNMSPSCQNQQLEITVPSLISLKVFSLNSISSILLIRNLPNLRYLTIKTTNICLNGNEWEILLVDYLPKIERFRLKMEFIFPLQNQIKEQVDQLLDTFRTPFLLEKHQWFVRCYSTERNRLNVGVLYTLPYTFEEFNFNNESYSKSTCPNEEYYLSCDYVQTLHIESGNYENFSQQDVRLPNIRYLRSDALCNDKLWPCISSLDRLISLCVTLPSEDFRYYQLQLLCERASCLYSLKIYGLNEFSSPCMTSFLSKSTTSIRRLDFLENRCYDNDACVAFASSSLGRQCEVLPIEVEYRTDVFYLINKMPNLRMLIFRCEYDRWTDTEFEMPLKNRELFQWLHQNLPSSCLIMRDSNLASSYIRLWIG